MRSYLRIGIVCSFLLAAMAAPTWAQGKEFHWLGDNGNDVTDGANWLEQPDPDTGALPGPLDAVVLRWGDRPPVPLQFNADATFEHILFNHADAGTTVDGGATINVTRSGGPTNVDIKSIETQGGHRLSTINTDVVAQGMVEARNGHDLVFNGDATLTTVHAYVDDDQVTKSDVIFNGSLTHTGYGEAKFMTGTGAVHFNGEVILDHQVVNEGFGIRNGLTLNLGSNFTALRFLPLGGGGLGLDTVDMYNNSTIRLNGPSVVGNDTDLFSRFGSGQNPNNTLDLNGFSEHVEFLGSHLEANFIVDYGATSGANTFEWETTHHLVGTYEFRNFEIGVDTLTLGGLGSTWWTALDTETDGGGSPDTEVDKGRITINGIPYGAYDPGRTTPYWTLVDPEISRNVDIFNFVSASADFDGDEDVDGADFLAWQRGFGQTGQTTNDTGDANGDGLVNGDDFRLWSASFGAGATPVAAVVPEPSTFAMTALALASIAALRRRRAAA